MKIAILIMAGGNGTRLWPISNTDHPKQFHKLVAEDKSMIASVFDIARSITPAENIFISTNRSHLDLVNESLPDLLDTNIIGESHLVGTMASIALANLHIRRQLGEVVVLILSSDCVLGNLSLFRESIAIVCAHAAQGDCIVSLGITPTQPHTGYGYMKCGEPVGDSGAAFECDGYVEKPSLDVAEQFLASNCYLWNTGIFAWNTEVLSKAIQSYAWELSAHYEHMEQAFGLAEFNQSLIDSIYENMHPISLDHAIMERIKKEDAIKSVLVDGCFDWEDIGSYKAWKNHLKQDAHGNACYGSVFVDPNNTPKNSILVCQHPYHMRISGELDQTIISVSNTGNILIIPVTQEQEIKKILNDHDLDSRASSVHRILNPLTGKKIILHNVESLNVNSAIDGDLRASSVKNISLSVENYQVNIHA